MSPCDAVVDRLATGKVVPGGSLAQAFQPLDKGQEAYCKERQGQNARRPARRRAPIAGRGADGQGKHPVEDGVYVKVNRQGFHVQAADFNAQQRGHRVDPDPDCGNAEGRDQWQAR